MAEQKARNDIKGRETDEPSQHVLLHEEYLDTIVLPVCKNCQRRRPEIGFHVPSREVTARCKACISNAVLFTHKNDNNPSPPPLNPERPKYCGEEECQGYYNALCRNASLSEELLVTRFRTFMIMRRMPHRHFKYRGHTIAFMQELEDWVGSLPRKIESLPILVVRQQGQDDCDHTDFRVRTWMVLSLLRALKRIHPELYDDDAHPWVIDSVELGKYEAIGCGDRNDRAHPGCGIYRELLNTNSIELDDNQAIESSLGPAGTSNFNDYEMADMGSSGVNGRTNTAGASEIAKRAVEQMSKTGGRLTSDTIAETLAAQEPIAWPSTRGQPENEKTLYFLVGAFPLRFMNTRADLNYSRAHHVTMEQYFDGLLYYWDGERYPFACHPTFRYVALNMTFRHHAWNKA